MKKNDILTGTCVDYTHDGLGIVKIDGFAFFIREVIVGETIKLKVLKLKKNYGYGKLIEVIEVSKNRTTPFCEYYGKCGGCQLQHMDMDEQSRFKQQIVANNMSHIGKLNIEVNHVLNGDQLAYRNKAQFPLTDEPAFAMGFYRLHSNDIISINRCPIQSDKINQLYQYLKSGLSSQSFSKSLRHILIKHAFATNQLMLVFIANKDNRSELKNYITQLTKDMDIESIILNINRRNDNVILGSEEYLLHGHSVIQDRLDDMKFNIAAKSFYQVNPKQTEVLYGKALEYAKISKNDTVIDLYCGVGTITLFLAKHAKQVIGIEIIEDAIKNAKESAKLNNIENVEFVCSDAGTYANTLQKEGKHPEVVVVDPPRKGCDDVTIMSIVRMEPDRVVYVSCNPATLARDIKKFEQNNYKCSIVQPVDMFPNTYHVETVALLKKAF
ncbi:23S rRNA (uracil(1939)-C(5))-methyltransferase RlmD [Breznakia pachnodae]|uniref:23S rRNA (Uracil1939-C5)-methyltransferase n=1 Tax=Breznakia pachnodae TaxID=265178 RepID=A0ABU0E7F8_9FIRM|nr:23S rRNA (uracil(1939)-C(5))-methyltransferase RlmD [Breznakia pachnodae]MDQ0362800.1 23S rRNA (uracil1939-C5)-methyltransferase [Breznakia pachnodae]